MSYCSELPLRFSQEEVAVSLNHVTKTRTSFTTTVRDVPQTFACTLWRPDRSPRALLFLCHGYGSYIWDGYDFAGSFFASHGFLVFGHDHLGHGRSTGERHQARTSLNEEFCAPLLHHCRARKALEGDSKPLFVMGHSMGCLISLLAVHQDQDLFQGLILLAVPYFTANFSNRLYAQTLRPLRLLVPKWDMPNSKLDYSKETTDEAWSRKYQEDFLVCQGGINARTMSVLVTSMFKTENVLSKLTVPVLFQHGSGDKFVPPDRSEIAFRVIGSKDKSIKIYPGGRHNLLVEQEDIVTLVLNDQLEWIKERL